MKRVLHIIIYVAATLAAQAQSPVLTLEQTIDLAQRHSLDAQQARFTFLGSYWTHRAFRAELLPSVTLGGSLMNYNRSIDQVRNYEDGRINYVENNQLSNSLSLSVSQQLPMTGGTVSVESYLYRLDQFTYEERTYNSQPLRVRYTQPLRSYNALRWQKKTEPLAYERGKRQYLEAMQQIAVTATSLYFSVLSAQSDYQQSLATERERTDLYAQTEQRFRLGTVSKSEVLQLELSLLNARMAVKRNQLTLADARFRLFTYLRAQQSDGVQLAVPTSVPDIVLSETDVEHRAVNASSHSVAQQLTLIESQRAVAQAKSARGVQLTLSGEMGLYQTAHRMADAYSRLRDNEIVGLTLSLPVFDWGMSRGRVQIAKANLEVTKTQLEQSEQTYRQDVRRQVQQFNCQSEQCRDAQRAEQIAAERYELTYRRFQAGAVTVTELNTAQQELEAARSQSIAQLQTFWTGYYNIQRSTLHDYIHHRDIDADFEKLINDIKSRK